MTRPHSMRFLSLSLELKPGMQVMQYGVVSQAPSYAENGSAVVW
jgi:hypothetical protein